jgi:predicted ATP-dependent serine protease
MSSEDDWKDVPDPDAPTPPRSFACILADDMTAEEGEVNDFVEGVLTEGGVSMVYGASNVGKSFWVLDLCAHIAMGTIWRDEIEVDQGCVVYVALEGSYGLKNRLKAMRKEGILKPGAPLYIVRDTVSLLDPTHGAKLAETVKEAASRSVLPCKLVVIDTMSRAIAGGNENSGEVMTAAVQSIHDVQKATGAHVLIVHHSGKNEAMGARGHSSLRAAIDTEIELYKNEDEEIVTVKITKQRDLEYGKPMPFRLRKIDLHLNKRQKMVTSCVVHHQDEMMAGDKTPKKRGASTKYHADQLLEFLPAQNATDWFTRAKAETGISSGKFYELKNELYLAGKFRKEVASTRLVIP